MQSDCDLADTMGEAGGIEWLACVLREVTTRPRELNQPRTIVKTLVSAEQIQTSVDELARVICKREAGRPLTVIAIMTGAIVFLADLIRKLDMPLRVGVIQTSSYRGTERGELSINAEMMPDIAGRDVLLVDDIFDTGHTLVNVIAMLDRLGPKSIRSAVLLLKRGRQEVTLRPDYVGFEIPDEFVVGYGLDYRDAYRNLPFLAALEPSDLEGDEP
jgi:hypoxanthine phosphoribosyltransferase